MIADHPGNAVGLVRPLRHRRVARPLGAADLLWSFEDLQAIIGVRLPLVDFGLGQFVRADRVATGQLGRGGVIGDGLDFQDMQAAKFGDLLKAERCIVDESGRGRVRHERLGHGKLLKNGKGRPFRSGRLF